MGRFPELLEAPASEKKAICSRPSCPSDRLNHEVMIAPFRRGAAYFATPGGRFFLHRTGSSHCPMEDMALGGPICFGSDASICLLVQVPHFTVMSLTRTNSKGNFRVGEKSTFFFIAKMGTVL
jgi:hypothetical protein